MSFPREGVLDNFNRANEGPPPSASWANNWLGNGLKVQSNALIAHVNAANNGSYWSAGTFGPDCEIYLTLASIWSSNVWGHIALAARIVDPTNATAVDGYSVSIESDGSGQPRGSSYYRIDNGVYTRLGSAFTRGSNWTAGERLGLELIGSTLQAYIFSGGSWSTLTTSRSDSTYNAAGHLSISTDRTEWTGDDFGGGTVGAGGAALPHLATPIYRPAGWPR